MLTPKRTHFGFSLIELMVAIAIVGILAAVAVPSYSNFIRKGEANSAWSDLQALSLAIEGRYRRTLTYPLVANDTAAVKDRAPSWGPSSKAAVFGFKYQPSVTPGLYRVTAVGQTTGKFKDCDAVLEVDRGTTKQYYKNHATGACKLTTADGELPATAFN